MGLWEHVLLRMGSSSSLCSLEQGILFIQILAVGLETPGRRLGEESRGRGQELHGRTLFSRRQEREGFIQGNIKPSYLSDCIMLT